MIADKDAMLKRWRELGEPEVPLPTGGAVYDVEKFLEWYATENPESPVVEVVRSYLGLGQKQLRVSPDVDT